jgi:saccharopine dehydrogenase-like NADP-dependent oxidoreductase
MQDVQEASQTKLNQRTVAMEERLNKFEALISVLPVWKEDLVRLCFASRVDICDTCSNVFLFHRDLK